MMHNPKFTGSQMLKLLFAAVAPFLFAGCLALQGQSFLDNQRYDEGLTQAKTALAENPGDPDANYFAGRYLLAQEKPEQALPYLEKAMRLAPMDPDRHFWLGVAHWSLFDYEQERAEYLRALALDSEHISANLYLGHSYMDSGEYALALARYDKVLSVDDLEPGALFNRAAALDQLGRRAEAREALLRFLSRYPDGDLGIRATNMLNDQGDFTYRNYILGRRTVPLRSIGFEPGSTRFGFDVRASLDVIGAMLENNQALALHLVAYCRDHAELAKARAKRVKQYLLLKHPDLEEQRLLLSWFGTGETISTAAGEFVLAESFNLITRIPE